MSDCAPDYDEDNVPQQPIRVWLYGDGFCSVDGELQMSAFGPHALTTIARKLLALGHDADTQLDVHRGGKSVQRVLLRDAAQQTETEF